MKPKTFIHLTGWMVALLCSPLYAESAGQTGSVAVPLVFNVTPNADWQPGQNVFLSADVRRNTAIHQEDIFHRTQFPGVFPRTAGQSFTFSIPNVKVGEKVYVQGYMCSDGTSDCYPSDPENPPSCAVQVHILGGFRPSCQPVFTWTGGQGDGGVICSADCR